MTFAHPSMLFLLAAPALWAAWEWSKSNRRLGLLIKTAVLALIAVALAEPRLSLWETDLAVAVLADASSSIPDEQLDRERRLIDRLRAEAGRALVRPISFDETTRRGAPADRQPRTTPTGTNLEVAVRDALAALPPDRVGRLLLLSDGRETLGSIERALYQAKLRGAPIDVIPLPGRAEPDLRLASLTLPARAFVGERFAIEIGVESPSATPATVELIAEGAPIGSSQTMLRAGRNLVTARARLDVEGAAVIRGTVSAPSLGEISFAGVIRLERPRALIISSETGERHLEQTLGAAGFAIERLTELSARRALAGPGGASPRESFELIVAENEDFEKWPLPRKEEIERFVSAGGGFLLIAGERNLYVEREADADDPLNRMLPATLAPPSTPETTAVVLVLDKSSSMEGKKMQLARQSAMGLIDNLRAVDRIGVLVFDNSFQWAVPLRKNDDPGAIKKLISRVVADGGTQIAPALHEAYRHVRPQEAVYKHILLLTDGISEEGDSIQLARQAAREKITISTIGLGQDVNRAYLERVAKTAEGSSYFVIDVSQLAQVVLRDVLEHIGSSVTEREFQPVVARRAEILDEVDLDAAGPLLGWVRFEAKPHAETILRVDEKDPLFVRWQYGLGRAAVFTSDAKNRWAANWVEWEGFDRFWANVARDLLPRSPATQAEVSFDRAAGEIVVRYRTLAPVEEPPRLFVLGPDGYRHTAKLESAGGTSYEARAPIGDSFGVYRIRAESDLDRFPETAFLYENTELERYGSDRELLETIAAATGGVFDPSPGEVFRRAGRAVERSLALWPGLLALAILLNLVELLARKGWLRRLGRWA